MKNTEKAKSITSNGALGRRTRISPYLILVVTLDIHTSVLGEAISLIPRATTPQTSILSRMHWLAEARRSQEWGRSFLRKGVPQSDPDRKATQAIDAALEQK